MKTINEKLQTLQHKIDTCTESISIMILGLGSVGNYLFDYLVSSSDPRLHIIVAGRNRDKLMQDVNIVKTAATIRRQMHCKISVEGECNLDDIDSVTAALRKWNPDFIVNTSRVYAGLKYGSISWHHLRAYGIWTPLSIRYARNIMLAYEKAECNAISINTSYSDAVIPWLKSAGLPFFDFGSGNLNHLIPRIKFHIAEKQGIANYNDIDITLATSHFHDVVISKEGHSEGQTLLIAINHKPLNAEEQQVIWKDCSIAMPVDQKRNMMNASSNYNIIQSIITAIDNHSSEKIHSPGVDGEIGGYPFIIDATGKTVKAGIDTSVFSLEDMRIANRESIYKDGIENVSEGSLFYTDELIAKVKKAFNVVLPKQVKFEEIESVGNFIIEKIIKLNI